jgi:hypothetical protein
LPPQLAALVALLKTPAAEKRLATGEVDDDPACRLEGRRP